MFEGVNQLIMVDISQQIFVIFIIYVENGCIDIIQDEVNIEFISFDFLVDLVVCLGELVEFNLEGNIMYSYVWLFGESLSDSMVVNFLVSLIDNIVYLVVIMDVSGDCQ